MVFAAKNRLEEKKRSDMSLITIRGTNKIIQHERAEVVCRALKIKEVEMIASAWQACSVHQADGKSLNLHHPELGRQPD